MEFGENSYGAELLYHEQFWQEVTDYEMYKETAADQRLHVSQAWDIFNKYILADAVCSIGKNRRCLLPITDHVHRSTTRTLA